MSEIKKEEEGESGVQVRSGNDGRCVLNVSLRVSTLALDLDGQTDEDKVSNEALKIS